MPSSVFFTEAQLAAMLGSVGKPANACNLSMIYYAAIAAEAYVSRLGVNVGEQSMTEFLPMVGGVTVGSSEYLNEYVNRRATFSEIPLGPENGRIILLRTPVKSLQSVYLNLAAWNQTASGNTGDWPVETLLDPTTYTMDWNLPGICQSGIMLRAIGSWPSQERSVKVTYTGGWTVTELNARYPELLSGLQYGIMQWLARDAVSRRMAQGMTGTSFSIEDFSVSLGSVSGSSKELLAGASGLPAIVLPKDVAITLAGEANLRRFLPI